MKKTLLVLSLLFAGFQSHSQVLISIIFGDKLNSPNLEFGLEGGVNYSKITNFQSAKPLGRFNLGFYFDFKIKNHFYIYTGVLVKSTLGIDRLTDNDLESLGATTYPTLDGVDIEGDYSQRLSYFLVPVLAKYRHKNNFYAELGPQTGLMYKSWIQFDSDIEGKDATIKEYNKEKINVVDFGGVIGIGYKFKSFPGLSVGIKYYQGFVDVYRDISNTKNSSLFFKVNIPIGAGKKVEEK